MRYGETYKVMLIDRLAKKDLFPVNLVYKYTQWRDFSTDKEGNGLWYKEKQIIGTCDFSVAGCKTSKAAKAKIRNYVKNHIWEE